MPTPHTKFKSLRLSLAQLDNLAVAFSGGVDSALLLYAAHEALGERVMAFTVNSCLLPLHELQSAEAFCALYAIPHTVLDFEALDVPGFAANPPERCYLCKRAMLEIINAEASRRGFSVIAEASNCDDETDYRPGTKAIAECGVKSPLKEAGFTKADIRTISQTLGLPTWDKPSYACLASRLPYRSPITSDLLRRIDAAESWLLANGLQQVRVRVHGDVARIECDEQGRKCFASRAFQDETNTTLKAFGFTFVTLDLAGFVSGSMNQTLNQTL